MKARIVKKHKKVLATTLGACACIYMDTSNYHPLYESGARCKRTGKDPGPFECEMCKHFRIRMGLLREIRRDEKSYTHNRNQISKHYKQLEII